MDQDISCRTNTRKWQDAPVVVAKIHKALCIISQITKLKKIVEGDSAVTDEKVIALRETIAKVEDAVEEGVTE